MSCVIFEEIARALEALDKSRLNPGQDLDHYLDDYIAGASTPLLADDAIDAIIQVCEEVGFPMAHDKTVWATTVIKFLGLIIDTTKRMVFIPDHKKVRLESKIQYILNLDGTVCPYSGYCALGPANGRKAGGGQL